MNDMAASVGLIGLGIMGSAMGANLVQGGFRAVGHDILPAAMDRFTATGGTPLGSVGAVAEASGILITSLPSVAALEQVVAALENCGPSEGILAETSTFSLDDKLRAQARLEALGIVMLDCPLSDSGEQAKTRDVLVYGSGPREAYERCLPIFHGFSRAPHYLGPFGKGSRMKSVANLLVAIHTAAAGEAFAMARMAALDPAQMFEVVADGAGGSSSLRVRGPMLIAEQYAPVRTMPLALWRKDMRVIAEFADSVVCPTPMFSAGAALQRGRRRRVWGAGYRGGRCGVSEHGRWGRDLPVSRERGSAAITPSSATSCRASATWRAERSTLSRASAGSRQNLPRW